MLQYRLAIVNDMHSIYEMYMDQSSNKYLTYDPMTETAFAGIYNELLSSGTLFVVTDGALIVATFRLIPKTHRQSHVLYLGSFVTSFAMQGMGIGSKALAFIREYAISNGFKRIELTVDIQNEAALYLYKKAGFTVEGIVKKSYRLEATGLYYDEYLMALLLE
jgi:RimJ/RimL family protein N-acetyltransferase